jgi:hypothetical protein
MALHKSGYFKKQFEGLPPKAAAIIALRAAMRAFPVLAQRRDAIGEAFWFWPAGDRAHHTLLVCRCFQSSAFVNSLTKDDTADAATADDAIEAAAEAAASASASRAKASAASAAAGAAAISTDIAYTQRLLRRANAEGDLVLLLAQPLWPADVPAEAARLPQFVLDTPIGAELATHECALPAIFPVSWMTSA